MRTKIDVADSIPGRGKKISRRLNISRARLAFLDHGASNRRLCGQNGAIPTPAARLGIQGTRTKPPIASRRRSIAREPEGETAESRCRTSRSGRSGPAPHEIGAAERLVAESHPARRRRLRSTTWAEDGRGPGSFGVGEETQPNRGALRGVRRRCKQSRQRAEFVRMTERQREEARRGTERGG